MTPALLLVPALGLILGPRVWVNRVLREHDQKQELNRSAPQVARDMLDRHGLHGVEVESTDLGDHYDPKLRVVRLSRHNIDRRTLSAVTTAAHEVAHALQHAEGYPPFELRTSLARVAQVTGELGTVLILAVPVSFLLTRKSLPPNLVGGAALAMLGTSTAAQLAALPTELDASFKRALPALQEHYISPEQSESAQRILFACSMTYAAAPLSTLLTAWPWLGSGGAVMAGLKGVQAATERVSGLRQEAATADVAGGEAPSDRPETPERPAPRGNGVLRGGAFEALFRRAAKPLIRGVLSGLSLAGKG